MPVQRFSRLCAGAVTALTTAIVFAAPVLAAAEGEHAKKGLPQLNPDSFASQVFWWVVTFGLLFWLMSKVALPRVAEVLEARQEKISNDLEKASALKAEAEGVMQAYEKALSDARANAQKEVAAAVATADAEAARSNTEQGAKLAAKARDAEVRIQVAKQEALSNLSSVAAEAALAATARLSGAAPSSEAAAAAVESVLKERA
ncbi:ATPase [Niveispirillum sp.]|uniref:F0F1 ATP synthase subunit B family protein n=1 Tax=Niveispirillum sp. TaxID=1917217 RepID=UPI0025D44F22|nr:ATPase [Niveispirillum sp.]